MPIRVAINGKEVVEAERTKTDSGLPAEEIKTFEVNRNFYIDAAKM